MPHDNIVITKVKLYALHVSKESYAFSLRRKKEQIQYITVPVCSFRLLHQ